MGIVGYIIAYIFYTHRFYKQLNNRLFMDHTSPIIDAYLELGPSHMVNNKVFGWCYQSFSGGTKAMG